MNLKHVFCIILTFYSNPTQASFTGRAIKMGFIASSSIVFSNFFGFGKGSDFTFFKDEESDPIDILSTVKADYVEYKDSGFANSNHYSHYEYDKWPTHHFMDTMDDAMVRYDNFWEKFNEKKGDLSEDVQKLLIIGYLIDMVGIHRELNQMISIQAYHMTMLITGKSVGDMLEHFSPFIHKGMNFFEEACDKGRKILGVSTGQKIRHRSPFYEAFVRTIEVKETFDYTKKNLEDFFSDDIYRNISSIKNLGQFLIDEFEGMTNLEKQNLACLYIEAVDMKKAELNLTGATRRFFSYGLLRCEKKHMEDEIIFSHLCSSMYKNFIDS